MRTGYLVALAQLAQGRGYQELNKHGGALRGTPGSRVHLQEVHTDYNYTRHNFTGYFPLPRTRALIEARTAKVPAGDAALFKERGVFWDPVLR